MNEHRTASNLPAPLSGEALPRGKALMPVLGGRAGSVKTRDFRPPKGGARQVVPFSWDLHEYALPALPGDDGGQERNDTEDIDALRRTTA